jgi:hypothetical protein
VDVGHSKSWSSTRESIRIYSVELWMHANSVASNRSLERSISPRGSSHFFFVF